MIVSDSRPGSTRASEDWVGATDRVCVVLDGLTAPDGVGGCIHGTPWYVSRLGHHILTAASDQTVSLRSAVRSAIVRVSAEHDHTCDLSDPGTPSSTVAVVRLGAEHIDALVLADSPVVVDLPHGIDVVTDQSVDTVAQDERAAALAAPTGSPEQARALAALVHAQRQVRNRACGYWIAGANPDAADHSVTRSWPRQDVQRLAAMTDGVSCLVETYQAMGWGDLLDAAHQRISSVIDLVRHLEESDPDGARWPRYKKSDDATIAYINL